VIDSKEDEIGKYTTEINILTSALAVQGSNLVPGEDFKVTSRVNEITY
jgi:hypothetical protein